MSWLFYVNPLNLVKWLAAPPGPPARWYDPLTHMVVPVDGKFLVEEGVIERIAPGESVVSVPTAGHFAVEDGAVKEVPPGQSIVVSGDATGLKPGLYEVREPGGPMHEVRRLPAEVAEAVPGKRRRDPHPHVTSTAHAGYCLIVDALKAFIRERLYEPTVVYLDKAAEAVLLQYCYEAGWLGTHGKARPDPSELRKRLPTLLGCEVVWDAPSFRFAGEDDPAKRLGPPLVPHGAKCAHSAPFATQPPKLRLGTEIPHQGDLPYSRMGAGIGKTVRPIDTVEIDGRTATVTKADVPPGKSMSPQTEELIRQFFAGKKFL